MLKTKRELLVMREAGRISAKALKLAGELIKPGVSTKEIDKEVHNFILNSGATPSFLGYGGFPASTCISVNDVVIHGIPSKECILKEGDIVSVDVGAKYKGFHGDNAATFPCGKVTEEAQALMNTTKESLYEALKKAKVGFRIGDIGATVQEYVEARGYSVVRDFVGHGVGADMHEDPSIPNYKTSRKGARLMPGMTLAIEPMINQGTYAVKVLEDEWTTVTVDNKLSAHFELSVAITDSDPIILTDPN